MITPWKIDENKELPLAVIEDTEEGVGVLEIGEWTPENIAFAERVVALRNNPPTE
jgi:hypothetical protein